MREASIGIKPEAFLKFRQSSFGVFALEINISHQRVRPGIVLVESDGMAHMRFSGLPLAQAPQSAGDFIMRFGGVRTNFQTVLQGLLCFSIILLLVQSGACAKVCFGISGLNLGRFFEGPLRVTPLL